MAFSVEGLSRRDGQRTGRTLLIGRAEINIGSKDDLSCTGG
jgi:hypothetical protein